MDNQLANALFERGWQYLPQYGWSHWDVRDNDGERIIFDTAEDAAEFSGIHVCKRCGE